MELQVGTHGIARFFIPWIHVQVLYTTLIHFCLVDCSLNLNDFLKVIL